MQTNTFSELGTLSLFIRFVLLYITVAYREIVKYPDVRKIDYRSVSVHRNNNYRNGGKRSSCFPRDVAQRNFQMYPQSSFFKRNLVHQRYQRFDYY